MDVKERATTRTIAQLQTHTSKAVVVEKDGIPKVVEAEKAGCPKAGAKERGRKEKEKEEAKDCMK